jgi:hypothetical protein
MFHEQASSLACSFFRSVRKVQNLSSSSRTVPNMKKFALLVFVAVSLATGCYAKREDTSDPNNPNAPKPPKPGEKSVPVKGGPSASGGGGGMTGIPGPGMPGGGMPKPPGK